MAHKRMFSKDITTSDAFREMPSSTQALYFHLGMEADDDGFLDNYRGLMRAINATDDDLRILLAKRFLIIFPSKIVVVKHWLINNTVRVDRYHETKHLEEKKALIIKDNGAYTESGIPFGNQMATENRIGEDSKKEIAEPISSLPVTEVRTSAEGIEREPKKQRDGAVLALREKLYTILEKDNGVRPTASLADYVRIQAALKHLKESDIISMVEDAVSVKTVHTVREVLTDRKIDIYRQENL